MGDIFFNPVVPPAALAVAGVAVAVLVVAAYALTRRNTGPRRRTVLAVMRLAVVLAILAILLRPMTVRPVAEPTDRPVFSILVDHSASMNTPDQGQMTRLEAVRDRLAAAAPVFANDMGARYDLAFFEFSGDVLSSTLPQVTGRTRAEGTETNLAAALTKSADLWPNRRKAGVLLISDGRENAGEGADRAASYLKSLNVPVWTVPVGAETQTKDVFVSAWLNQNFMFVKQPALVRVAVAQTGYPDWYAKVNLYREGRYVGSQQVMMSSGGARLEFPVKEDAKGTYQYRVEVEPLEGESDIRNNRRSVFARVIDEKSRILVVEGQPSWDSKFMLRSLRADPNLQVTALYYIKPDKPFAITEKLSNETAEKEVSAEGVRLPRTREELFQYDCVVLGRHVDTALSAEELRLLKDYLVERGGSVVFARGRAYEGSDAELAELEPVTWDVETLKNARFELTPEGRTSPVFDFNHPKSTDVIIRELPEMISITRVQSTKALSVVLAKSADGAQAAEVAAISYQRYGKGKVMSIGTGGLWQWSFLPERLGEYDDVYDRFWAQMMRWLLSESDFLPGQDISLRVDKNTYQLGEPVRLAVWTKDEPQGYEPAIEIRPEDGPSVTLRPQREPEGGPYVAQYTPETEGEYTATLRNNVGEPKEDTARFTAYSDSIETRLVAADPELMAEIAESTGGCEIPLDRLADLPAMVKRFELTLRERTKATDAWDRGWVFALLAGLLAVEWFGRRRAGMV